MDCCSLDYGEKNSAIALFWISGLHGRLCVLQVAALHDQEELLLKMLLDSCTKLQVNDIRGGHAMLATKLKASNFTVCLAAHITCTCRKIQGLSVVRITHWKSRMHLHFLLL